MFEWPLRIVAFVSAAGVDAGGEVDALVDAVATLAGRYRIELDLYVSEPDILKRLGGAGARDFLRVATIPPDPAALIGVLGERPADIVHFFCHGRVDASQQALELATVADRLTRHEQGSVELAIWRLLREPGLQRAWLVVLNCCQSGAAPPPGDAAVAPALVGSMAYRIVREGGVPACIGMCEPIAPDDAYLVTRSFYRALLAEVLPLIASGEAQPVRLCDIANAARMALFDAYKKDSGPGCSRWSLPALYVSGPELRIKFLPRPAPAAVPAALQVKLEAVAKFLADLPAGTPEAVRDQALRLLEGVPADVLPDRYGRDAGTAHGG